MNGHVRAEGVARVGHRRLQLDRLHLRTDRVEGLLEFRVVRFRLVRFSEFQQDAEILELRVQFLHGLDRGRELPQFGNELLGLFGSSQKPEAAIFWLIASDCFSF